MLLAHPTWISAANVSKSFAQIAKLWPNFAVKPSVKPPEPQKRLISRGCCLETFPAALFCD